MKRLPIAQSITRDILLPKIYTGQPDESKSYTFDICPGCGNETQRGVYAIAQMAMGHEVIGTCPKCSTQFEVRK